MRSAPGRAVTAVTGQIRGEVVRGVRTETANYEFTPASSFPLTACRSASTDLSYWLSSFNGSIVGGLPGARCSSSSFSFRSGTPSVHHFGAGLPFR
jgi:hypothetical protein